MHSILKMMHRRLPCYLKSKRLYKTTVSVLSLSTVWSKKIEKMLLNSIAKCYQCHVLGFHKEIQRKKVEVELVLQSIREIENTISLLMCLMYWKNY